jgi:predicted ester cyclase
MDASVHQRRAFTMASEASGRANLEIVRDYTERVFNGHDPDAATGYLASDMRWHGGLLGTVEGAENVVNMLRGFLAALPDLHATEQDTIVADDSVVVRYVVEATHKGNLLGIEPTGIAVRWDAIDVYRLAEGKIVEEWAGDDTASIFHQVGAYTPPWLVGQ